MITQANDARRLSRRTLFLSVAVLLICPPRVNAQSESRSRKEPANVDTEKVAKAGLLFQKNCISCHQPPDLKFATDRAWLDQLNRTA